MSDPKQNKDFLEFMDGELARLWRLGGNAIIGWSALRGGIAVLSVPQFLLPNVLPNYENNLVGSRKMRKSKLQAVSDICEIEPYTIKFPASSETINIPWKSLDKLIRRYSIIKTNDKAVILFDIVHFSRYTALEQVTALNSLSYSINIAQRRAKENGLDIVVSAIVYLTAQIRDYLKCANPTTFQVLFRRTFRAALDLWARGRCGDAGGRRPRAIRNLIKRIPTS